MKQRALSPYILIINKLINSKANLNPLLNITLLIPVIELFLYIYPKSFVIATKCVALLALK